MDPSLKQISVTHVINPNLFYYVETGAIAEIEKSQVKKLEDRMNEFFSKQKRIREMKDPEAGEVSKDFLEFDKDYIVCFIVCSLLSC